MREGGAGHGGEAEATRETTSLGVDSSDSFLSDGDKATVTVVFAAAGAAAGALIGAAVRLEHWRPVPGGHVRLGIAPVRRGAAVSLAVGF